MAVVKVYDQDKKEQGELTLTPEVFEVAVRRFSTSWCGLSSPPGARALTRPRPGLWFPAAA